MIISASTRTNKVCQSKLSTLVYISLLILEQENAVFGLEWFAERNSGEEHPIRFVSLTYI